MRANHDVPAARTISVAVVEDDDEIRRMLTCVLETDERIKLAGSFSTGDRALEQIPGLEPDVVIMDIQLPGIDGAECTRRLKASCPNAQILVFTVFRNPEQVFRALEMGASGYILKRTSRTGIVEAVRLVAQGGAPMSPEIARLVVESFRRPAPKFPGLPGDEPLTGREEEVLGLLAKGMATKEIATALGISFDTVRYHLKHIYEKLHVRSRTEAVLKYLS